MQIGAGDQHGGRRRRGPRPTSARQPGIRGRPRRTSGSERCRRQRWCGGRGGPRRPCTTGGATWGCRTGRDERSETAHNPPVAGSHPARSTCFDGSETRVPSGYTKGRRPRTSAFSRYIASSGNHFEHTASLKVSVSRRRATSFLSCRRLLSPQYRPELSLVSSSRRVWVNGCCERSTGRR